MPDNHIRVTGWHAENCKRADDSVILYDSRTNEAITLERAHDLMRGWSRDDETRRIHADVPMALSLELLLKHHDWTFEYADGYGDWARGKMTLARIRELMSKMEDQELAHTLFDKYNIMKGI